MGTPPKPEVKLHTDFIRLLSEVLLVCFVFYLGYGAAGFDKEVSGEYKSNPFSPYTKVADVVPVKLDSWNKRPGYGQPLELANRVKYRFRIKTKTGGIVGNILIEGRDVFNCISKLNKRYPNNEILEAKKV